MRQSSRRQQEEEEEEEEKQAEELIQIHQGIPLIAFDLFINISRKRVRVFDAFQNPVFSSKSPDASQPRRVLLDSSGNPLLSLSRSQDGSWKGVEGDGCGQVLFTAEQTVNTFSKVEFKIALVGEDGVSLSFAMRGCLFWRSCTIYRDNSIVAQTSLMYKLGFRKYFVRRSKFRVTVFPGFPHYNFIAALLLLFLDAR